ncbi:hypothetical protein D3C80_1092860 [compost metagenome]
MEVKHLRLRPAVDTCQWLIASLIGIHIGERHAIAGFLQQSETFPQEGGDLALAARLAQVLALQPYLFLRAPSEWVVTELHMLQGFAAVQAVTYHFAESVFGVVTVLPAVVTLAFFHRAAKGIVTVIDALIVHNAVMPLAELPLIQQVGGRIVAVALGVWQGAVLA